MHANIVGLEGVYDYFEVVIAGYEGNGIMDRE